MSVVYPLDPDGPACLAFEKTHAHHFSELRHGEEAIEGFFCVRCLVVVDLFGEVVGEDPLFLTRNQLCFACAEAFTSLLPNGRRVCDIHLAHYTAKPNGLDPVAAVPAEALETVPAAALAADAPTVDDMPFE
jgi:hypothetical protein